MAKKAEIMTVLGWDASAFNRGIKSAGKAVSELATKTAGVGVSMAKWGSAIGAVGGAGFVALSAKAVQAAADMETLQVGFETLLGSADKAKERMNFLAKFAAETPFELEELAKGNRVLELFSKGALSGAAGMKLVGDTASAAQQPFEDVAVWVGRLYDGLQNNRPVGEAMQRLQEMAVFSGQARAEIEKLSGNAAWMKAAEGMGRFTGQMKKQAVTWNGLMSTFGDTIKGLFRSFGQPIMDRLKPILDRIITLTDGFNSKAAEFGRQMADTYAGVINVIAALINDPAKALEGLKLGFLARGEGFMDMLTDGIKKAAMLFGSLFMAAAKDIGNSIKSVFTGEEYESEIGKVMGAFIGGAVGSTKSRDKFSAFISDMNAKGAGLIQELTPSTSGLDSPVINNGYQDKGMIGSSRLDDLIKMQGGRTGASQSVFGRVIQSQGGFAGTQSKPFPFGPGYESQGAKKQDESNNILKETKAILKNMHSTLSSMGAGILSPTTDYGYAEGQSS